MSQNNKNRNPFTNNQRNAQNNNNNNKPSSSRFSRSNNSNSGSRLGSLSRFGRGNVAWTVMPLSTVAVHISLEGMGDPFHRLLGHPMRAEMSDLQKIVQALQADPVLRDELGEMLDATWATYAFEGAALLFPWDEEVRKPYTQVIYPLLPQKQQNSDKKEDQQSDEDAPIEQFTLDCTCLRAIDMAFILNVLGRTRANVVVADTPLALEAAFLRQNVICEDPRIVEIARVTGAIQEMW